MHQCRFDWRQLATSPKQSSSRKTAELASWATPRAAPLMRRANWLGHGLHTPLNPNGRPNSDVLKPWVNGFDLIRRARDWWIVDFGWTMSEKQAAFYEDPFAYDFREGET